MAQVETTEQLYNLLSEEQRRTMVLNADFDDIVNMHKRLLAQVENDSRNRTIFLTGLHLDIHPATHTTLLLREFQKYGDIEDILVPPYPLDYPRFTGPYSYSDGTAHILFKTRNAAYMATRLKEREIQDPWRFHRNQTITCHPSAYQFRENAVMAKKRKLAPESSQLVEPPFKQHQSKAQQENLPVQEDKENYQAFGQTNSLFGQNNSSNNPFSPKPFGSTTPFGSQTDSSISGGTSTGVFGAAHTPFLLEFIAALPAYKYASYDIRKQLLESIPMQMVWKQQLEAFGATGTPAIGSSGFGQKPAFGGFGPFGRAIPTSVRKPLEAIGGVGSTIPTTTLEQYVNIHTSQAFGSTGAPDFGDTSTPAFGATSAPPFGATRISGDVRSIPFSISSRPTLTEEDGGTSGQTAKLESISAMPPYNYERFESCFAIAGADYCLIAVDFTCDHTKISQLSGKSVMAGCCGFQADVEALQEVLSALNLKYEGQHKMPMSCPEMHRLFRHFEKSHPILQSIVLAGLDSEGKGCVFQYHGPDAVAPQEGYSSQNSGSRLIVPPILKYKLPSRDVLARLSETEAVRLAKTLFASTIPHTGDRLEIVVVNASGIHRQCEDLRKDCD